MLSQDHLIHVTPLFRRGGLSCPFLNPLHCTIFLPNKPDQTTPTPQVIHLSCVVSATFINKYVAAKVYVSMLKKVVIIPLF
jgi:hypothetical protein